MLLTIHNLPNTIRYSDIKLLLQTKCGINEVILDNLLSNGRTKKVTVGLAEEGDAAILVRKINGLYFEGQQLYVENVRQKKASEQPYRSKDFLMEDALGLHDYQPAWDNYQNTDRIQQHNALPRDSFQKPDNSKQSIAFQRSNFQTQPYVDTQQVVTPDPMALMMNYNMTPMYYVPAVATQNTFLDYGSQAQQVASAIPQYQETRVQQESSFGFGVEKRGAVVQENRPWDIERSGAIVQEDRPRDFGRSGAIVQENRPRDFGKSGAVPQENRLRGFGKSGVVAQENRPRDFGRSGAVAQDNRPRDFGQDNSRPYGNKQHQSSPNRGDRHLPVEEFSNRLGSRWDNPTVDPHDARRRSRSPQRTQFNSREPFFVQNNNPGAFQHNSRDRDLPQSHREPVSRKRSQGRSETFNSNDFGDPMRSGALDRLLSSNTYGSHVTEREQPVRAPPASVWENRRDERIQWKHPPVQNRDDRNRRGRDDPLDAVQSRNNQTRALIDNPESFQLRNSNRTGQRPFDEQQTTNATRAPSTKRFADRRDERDEIQPKRFAAPKPREDFAKLWKQGPQSSQNFRSKPVRGWKEGTSTLLQKAGPSRFNPSTSSIKPKPNVAPPPHHQNKWNTQVDTKQQSSQLKLVSLLRRDQTWRSQAAAEIARDILKNLEITDMDQKDEIVARLKSTIRSRIEVMMADQLSVPMLELVKRYRSKYRPDSDHLFFMAVLDDIKADANKEGDNPKKESGKTTKVTTNTQNVNENGEPTAKVPASGTTLRKYINSEMKQSQRLELEDEHLYELEPDLQKLLDEECDILCDLFMAECEVPDNENEKSICERISDQAADDFRKLVRLNVTKRLLNVTTDLAIRMHARGGPLPKQQDMENYLKSYGVSLSKGEPTIYIVKCDSYKSFDALCKLGSFEIGHVRMIIRPLNLIGRSSKSSKAQKRPQSNNLIQGEIDRSDENLLEKPGHQVEKPKQQVEKPQQKVEKPRQQMEKPQQQMEKPGQQVEKPGQQVKKPGQQVEKPGQQLEEDEEQFADENEFADEDEFDHDLEEVVKEYSNLEYDCLPESEDNEELEDDTCLDLKEDFDVDESDLEDY